MLPSLAIAQADTSALLRNVTDRLVDWPRVSGAKPLRGTLVGNYRIRTGGYRLVFRYETNRDTVVVWKIGYRGDIYE